MTYAVCFYGTKSVDTTELQAKLQKWFPFPMTFFHHFDEDKFLALETVSHKKKTAEFQTHVEFKICMAYDTDVMFDVRHIEMVYDADKKVDLQKNFIYYMTGGFDKKHWLTSVNPCVFIARSWEFDRACEYHTNLKNIPVNQIRGPSVDDAAKFYYHLQTLSLSTECVNYENRSLFIRAT
jgi:hypothetical protein